MKMKRIFRRNQIIITTLAIMIAAAGYLNYSGKKEVAGGDVYEAGVTEISDEDILAENQAVSGGAAGQNAENVSSGDVNGDGGQLQ
ncbi:SpoIIIAH-like family protein, partial [[Clostridium] symbiosum]